MIFLGPFLAAAALLVVAGAAKVLRPGDLATALRRSTGMGTSAVRVGAAGECAVGLAAIAHPSPLTAALVAASYGAFALYVAWLRWQGGPLATCGCFGAADTPPTFLHIAVDLAFAGSALAVMDGGGGGWLPDALAGQPAAGWPLVAAAATVAFLAHGILVALAEVEGVRRLYGTTP